MSRLRKKILKLLLNRSYSSQLLADDLEQITDDFSVKLIEWLNENADFFHGENQYHYNNKWYTTQELQQYFKQNIYGKE